VNITATLLGQIAAFVLLIWFVNKVLWGPVSQMLEDRQKKIADGLAAGEKGQRELANAEKRAKEILQQAKSKATEIVNQAERRATEIIEEAKHDARVEGQRLVDAAHAEIEQEAQRAREALRGKVAEVALAGASRILKREVDARSHEDILNDLVKQL